uniref:metallophosphoesterase domain-containing protein 1 n=1 Tax=Monopterus albus TaxID=43700 RepID=UPI0009B3C4F6|nr:metallophosphoesterase domain-containing protein 1-like [Monopterus albus]
MAFTLSEIMAARRQQSQAQSHAQRGNRTTVEVDEYSTNPTQAFTFYNINQGRFQPPHVHMVDPIPHDTPKPPGYTRFVCISDTHSRTDTIQMPYGDVFIHAGDFTELGLPSEVKKFNDWLGSPGTMAGASTCRGVRLCWTSGTRYPTTQTSWSHTAPHWVSWTGSRRRCNVSGAWSCSTRSRGESSPNYTYLDTFMKVMA